MSGSRCLPVDPSNAKINANNDEMQTAYAKVTNALFGQGLAVAA